MSEFDWNATGAPQPVTLYGADVLAKPCAEVVSFDARLRALVANMYASMYASHGVGIAANQIGVGLRIFTIDCPDDQGGRVIGHVVNPVYRVLDETPEDGEEGCLSLPGGRAAFPRPAVSEVTGVDVYGDPVRYEGRGYAARCLQHETDHLDGHLFIDRLTEAERLRVLGEHRAELGRATSALQSPASPFVSAR